MSTLKFNNTFLVPSGIIENKSIFNRSVWHNGDKLRANTLNKIYEHKGEVNSAGHSIKDVIYEQIGACPFNSFK